MVQVIGKEERNCDKWYATAIMVTMFFRQKIYKKGIPKLEPLQRILKQEFSRVQSDGQNF